MHVIIGARFTIANYTGLDPANITTLNFHLCVPVQTIIYVDKLSTSINVCRIGTIVSYLALI